MITGPTNTTELRDLLASRAYPDAAPGGRTVQALSDRMRDKAVAIGEVFFGLVPDTAFQQLAGNVLHDLCVMGEQKLCQLHGVDIEHAALRVLGQAEAPKASKPSKK